MAEPASAGSSRAPLGAALAVASAAVCAALWVVPYLPTGDGPQHLMTGHIDNHFDDQGTVYSYFLSPAPQFAGRGFSAVYVPLEAALGWRRAAQAALALSLLAWAWGFVALCRAVAPGRQWLGVLGFATAFQWSLYLGFFAFLIGSACGFAVLALALSVPRLGRRHHLALAALLLLQSLLHVFSAMLTGAVLMAVVLVRAATWRERLPAGLCLAAAALPAAGVFTLAALDASHMAATIRDADRLLFEPLPQKLGYLLQCFVPGDRFRGLGLAALAALGLWRGLARARHGDRVALALLVCGVACLLLATFGPLNIPGWQLFFPRFLPLGLMLPLALIDVERWTSRGLRLAFLVATLGYSLASVGSAARLNLRLAARCADALSGLSAPIHRSLPRLAVVRDSWMAIPPAQSPVPYLVPLRSLGALYVAEQGGIIADMFVGSAPIHQFVWRRDHFADFPDIPDLQSLQKVAHLPPHSAARRAVVLDLAAHGSLYEDVILYTDPADTAEFIARGYAEDFRRGDLYLGHFVGCEAELVLPAAMGARSVSLSWWPRPQPTWRRDLAGLTPAADGRLHVPLAQAPCGEVAIAVEAAGAGCEGPAVEGGLRARLDPGRSTVIECRPR